MEDLISSYIDRAAFAADTEFAKKQLEELENVYKAVKESMSNVKNASGTPELVKNVKESTSATDLLVTKNKELTDTIKKQQVAIKLAAAEKKLSDMQSKQAAEEEAEASKKARQEIKEKAAAIKEEKLLHEAKARQIRIETMELNKTIKEQQLTRSQESDARRKEKEEAKEAAAAAKAASWEKQRAGTERLKQMRAEKEALEKLADAEKARRKSEEGHAYGPQATAAKGGVSPANTSTDKFDPANDLERQLLYLTKTEQGLRAVQKAQKEYAVDLKENKISQEKYNEVMVAAKAVELEYKKQIELTNAELKARTNLDFSIDGSVGQAKAQIALLARERDSITAKEGIASPEDISRIAQLNAEIDKNNKLIDDNSDKLGKQKINIGNYSGAVDFLKESLSDVSRKIEENTKAGQGGTAATQQLIKEQSVLEGIVNSQAGGYARATLEIRANQEALLQMRKAGMEGSEAYKQLSESTAKLKRNVSELTAETKNLGSRTFAFDSMLQGAQALAGAYSVAQGAAALFGEKNEDLQKTFVKLQAIMTVTTGLQSIVNSLQAESSLMLGLMTVKEKALMAVQMLRNFVLTGSTAGTIANTAATTANAAAQTTLATATTSAATAMKVLRFALIATGIGAILLLLPLLASGLNKASNETKDLARNQKTLQDINSKAIESYSKEVTGLKLLVGEYQNVNTSVKRKKEIQDELQKSYPSYFADLDKHADKEAYIAEQANKVTQALMLQAKVQAAQSILTEKYQEVLKKQFDPTAAVDNWDAIGATIKNAFGNVGDAGISLSKTATKNIKKAEDEYNSFETFIQGFVTRTNAEIDLLGGDPKKGDPKKEKTKKELDSLANLANEYREKDAKELEKFSNDQLAALRDTYKEMYSDQSASYEDRLKNAQKYYETSLILIEKNKEAQKRALEEETKEANKKASKIEDPQKRADAVIQIEKYKTDKLANINQQYALQDASLNKELAGINSKITEDYYNDLYEKAKTANKRIQEANKQNFQNAKDDIDISKNDKLLQLEKDFASKRIGTIEEYQDQKKKIEEDANIAQKKLDLDRINTAIKVFEALYGIKNIRLIKLAKDLEVEINRSANERILTDQEKVAEKQSKLFEKVRNTTQQTFDFIAGMQAAGGDREKNKLQEESDELEKRAQREIELINASTASEQDKANKIAILNARTMAQKEQIAQRQKKIDQDQAKTQKAMAVFNIILSTAQAVMKAWSEGDPYTKVARAIAAGVAGAAQLAVAVATPIPKFKHGKNNQYEGPAIVGDGGVSEVIKRSSGHIEVTPAKDTLTHLGKYDIVYPNMTDFMMKNATPGLKALPVNNDGSTPAILGLIGRKMDNVANEIRNKKELSLSSSGRGMEALWKWGANQTKYVDENTNW